MSFLPKYKTADDVYKEVQSRLIYCQAGEGKSKDNRNFVTHLAPKSRISFDFSFIPRLVCVSCDWV